MVSEAEAQSLFQELSKQVAKVMGVPIQEFRLDIKTPGQMKTNYDAYAEGGATALNSAWLANANKANVEALLSHELTHDYLGDVVGQTPLRHEAVADAMQISLGYVTGGLSGQNAGEYKQSKWDPYAIANKRGWLKAGRSAVDPGYITNDNQGNNGQQGNNVSGKNRIGGEVGASVSGNNNGNASRGGHSGDQGSTSGNTSGSTSSSSQGSEISDILGFISGSMLRNTLNTNQWDAMITFATKVLQDKGINVPSGTQPLQLFQEMFGAMKDMGAYKDALKQGIAAKVWTQDGTSPVGYVYSNQIGVVGSGAAGAPPPHSGIGTPPPAPGGTKSQVKNNEATFQMWLQQNNIPVTPKIQNLIDQAGKQGWSKDRFELAVENQTQAGAAYLAQQTAAKAAGFTGILNSWQLPTDGNGDLAKLVQEAAKNNWSQDQFQQAVEQTQAFQKAFPGIFNPNGSLKMDPTAYNTAKLAFQTAADTAGLNVGDNKMAWLFRNNVSPDEFSVRAKAVQTLRDNQQYFKAFNQQLQQMGMPQLSKGDQFKFIMGEGNAQYYKVWQDASTRYAGEQAGISFGHPGQGYDSLGQKTVAKVAAKGFDLTTMQQGFADLATKLRTTMPESQLEKFNISKQDLVELEFGGPKAAAIKARVDQITANIGAYGAYGASSRAGNVNLGATQAGQQQKYGQGP